MTILKKTGWSWQEIQEMTFYQFNTFLKSAIKLDHINFYNLAGYVRVAVNADQKQFDKFSRLQGYKLKTL